jgi:hypothetical protein
MLDGLSARLLGAIAVARWRFDLADDMKDGADTVVTPAALVLHRTATLWHAKFSHCAGHRPHDNTVLPGNTAVS